ncbi:MAG: hypothetical protein ACREMF_03945 [Gemmatimonadales bacterium]
MGYRMLGLCFVMMLTACRERGSRPADRLPPPDSLPAESTHAVGGAPDAGNTSPGSPFPADRDTTPLAQDLSDGGAAGALPRCGSGTPPITADSIGPFRLGVSLAELERRCPRLRYGWVMISDGYPVPTVAARVGGAVVMAFAIDSSPAATLHRVELLGTGPRTAEGIGVGATLAELQRLYGAPQASESDCILRVWFDARPGLAFRMEYPPSAQRECGVLSAPPLLPQLRVASVILVAR